MTSLSAAVNSASAESLWVVRDKVSFLSTLPAPGFALLEVTAESKYLPAFLRFHAQGIQQFFPHFDYTPDPADVILFVLRDMVPVGLFIAQAGEPGEMNVLLDYVAPG